MALTGTAKFVCSSYNKATSGFFTGSNQLIIKSCYVHLPFRSHSKCTCQVHHMSIPIEWWCNLAGLLVGVLNQVLTILEQYLNSNAKTVSERFLLCYFSFYWISSRLSLNVITLILSPHENNRLHVDMS